MLRLLHMLIFLVCLLALACIPDSAIPPDPGDIHALIRDSRYIDPVFVYTQDRYLILPLDYPYLSVVKFFIKFPVAMPKGKHPFPSRTRKLSPSRPMIL
jgi:hypothetical protein